MTAGSGNLKRAAVALAQDWRMDKVMRNLEALMIVADKEDPNAAAAPAAGMPGGGMY